MTERKERQFRIEEQNERLELLNNTNEVLRDVNRELVAASTRKGIERAVCERFATSDLFDVAWIGDRGIVDGTVRRRTAAGADEATLDARLDALQTGDPAPVDRALDDGEAVFVPGDETSAPEGTDPGATVVVPLTYQEASYGALVVSSRAEGAFDAIDRTVFAELGATIADAISAVQSKQTLATDNVTELEFRLDTIDDPLVGLSAALDCGVELDRVARDSENERVLYCTVRGCDPEAVEAYVADADHVEAAQHLNTYDGRCAHRLRVDETSVATVLAQYGASVRSLSVTGGEGRLTAEVSASNDVRATVEALTSTYPAIDLLAQREHERTVETEAEFRTRLEESLTPRQQEAAQTAYFAGFFAWPREQSGEEVAATMGITQSTFTQHLRAAERKLFGALFDDAASTPAHG
ncbi:MAG: bacterio-opsin activator domain-containing protein [Haloferacaceae archaeon]